MEDAIRTQRAADTPERIIDAAIEAIAEVGMARVTHRLIADKAKVSLASTTYHFERKFDILNAASERLLANYLDAFKRVTERRITGRETAASFQEFALRIVLSAADTYRTGTIAWQEIMLEAGRHPWSAAIARRWFAELAEAWHNIAAVFGEANPGAVVRPAMDTVVGLLFAAVPLGLSRAQIAAVLIDGADLGAAWRFEGVAEERAEHEANATKRTKSERTRARVLAAAIDILINEGPAGLTYRNVAKKAQLTVAAPTYYFKPIDALFKAAHAELFEIAKDRYRDVMSGVDYAALDIDQVVDLTTAVFVREATEYRALNLASYRVSLEAVRRPDVRPMLWHSLNDQSVAWRRTLEGLSAIQGASAVRVIDPLLVQCLFSGKLVKVMATGANVVDLARARSEFSDDLRALLEQRFWL